MNKFLNKVFDKLNSNTLNFELELSLLILRLYNPRISELLDANIKDFYPNRFLILKAKKKSRNIIIRDPNILQLIEYLISDGRIKIFQNLNYYLVYKECFKRYPDIISSISYKKKRKITHSFRYWNIDNITDETYIRDVLNHQRLSTQRFYTNKIRRNNNGND